MRQEFDDLKLYFGDDYVINEHITVHQPTIGEIVEMGEERYYGMIYTLTAIPSDMKAALYDMGIDYEELSDFELFLLLSKSLVQEDTKILFGMLDFQAMQPAIDKESKEMVLVDYATGITIDRHIHTLITGYIQRMHSIKPKIEKAANQYTKKILIEENRNKLNANKNKPYQSTLKNLISAMVNHPGFKYKKNELREVGIVEFMDSVQRISVIQSADALLKGCYSGMIDTSKINKKELNWLRELD